MPRDDRPDDIGGRGQVLSQPFDRQWPLVRENRPQAFHQWELGGEFIHRFNLDAFHPCPGVLEAKSIPDRGLQFTNVRFPVVQPEP